MKNWLLYLLILITAVLTACSSTSTTEPNVTQPVEIALVAKDIVFDTNRLEITAGQPVKLTLHNEGVLEHDFSIMEIPHDGEVAEGETEMSEHDMSHVSDEPEVHVAAPTGGSNTIEFTPSEQGEYEFLCTVSGHKEAGMVGTLVVKAP